MVYIISLLFFLTMNTQVSASMALAESKASSHNFDDLFSESEKIQKVKKTKPQCEDIIGQIYEDVSNSKDPKQKNYQPNFHWKKISWLEALLSDPTTSKVVEETLYVWDNYNILLRNGQIIGITGQYPGKKAIKTNLNGFDFVKMTIAEIGTPKQIITGELTQFSWVCRDPKNSLTATIDEKGSVVSVLGNYCPSSKDCVTFEANGDESFLQKSQQKGQKQ